MAQVEVGNQLEAAHVQSAIQEYIHRRGRTRVPSRLIELVDDLAAITRHKSPYPATRLAHPRLPADSGLLSYSQAAQRLGVSARTVSRMVANNELETVGRRITRASVRRLTKEGTP